EGGTLLHCRVRTVVALDVLDVLGAVTVGLVGEDLLHALLGGADVEFGGHEESGLPEAHHQHRRDDDRGEQADDAADHRHRTLRAFFRAGLWDLTVLPGLPRLSRLSVLRLAVLARLSVLAGLLTVLLCGLAVLAVLAGLLVGLLVVAGLLTELLGRRVLR